MKGKCCKCGCEYKMSAEEEEMYFDGGLEREICEECFMMEEESCFGFAQEYPEFSDADPGL